MRKAYLILCVVLISGQYGWTDSIDITITPNMSIPIGESANMYEIGYGAEISSFWSPESIELFGISGGLGYLGLPTQADTTLSALTLAAGAGVRFYPIPRFGIDMSLRGGMYYGIYDNSTNFNVLATAGLNINFLFSNSFSIGIGTAYNGLLTSEDPLYTGLTASVAGIFTPGGASRQGRININKPEVLPVFPIFFKWYDTNEFGTVTIKNKSTSTAKNVKIFFHVNEFMDAPKLCHEVLELKRGDSISVPVYALFRDNILSVTEQTKVAGVIKVNYEMFNEKHNEERTETIVIYDRNAIVWDDDRRAASFVTAKDPAILQFSKEIAGGVRESPRSGGDLDFRIAMGIFEGLNVYGMKYVVDPASSYENLSVHQDVIDYLQFPRQSLQYRSGDCDDLTVLYCALLESIGLETALITVPGHIFPAFALGMTPAEAEKTFKNMKETMIVKDDKIYVPVEATIFSDGFVKAWEKGVLQWNEHGDEAKLYPVHDAWNLYDSVGIRESVPDLKYPAWEAVETAYEREIVSFIKSELEPQITYIQTQINTLGASPKLLNRMATLYARYGLYDEAKNIYRKIISTNNYLPAFNNLGNICLIQKSFDDALYYFNKANSISPDQRRILAAKVRALQALNKYDEAKSTYNRLIGLYPEYADRYAYLKGTSVSAARAASGGAQIEQIEWSD
jgi:tetratricopeptide (TPR) repeat protein